MNEPETKTMCQRLLPREAIEAIEPANEFDRFSFEESNIPSDGDIRSAFEDEDEAPFCKWCNDAMCVHCMGRD